MKGLQAMLVKILRPFYFNGRYYRLNEEVEADLSVSPKYYQVIGFPEVVTKQVEPTNKSLRKRKRSK